MKIFQYICHSFLFVLVNINLNVQNVKSEYIVEDKPRIWNKIPKYFVKETVYQFLNENMITNCYYYKEYEEQLLLKCWKNNHLADVTIQISNTKKKKKIYAKPYLSIVV